MNSLAYLQGYHGLFCDHKTECPYPYNGPGTYCQKRKDWFAGYMRALEDKFQIIRRAYSRQL